MKKIEWLMVTVIGIGVVAFLFMIVSPDYGNDDGMFILATWIQGFLFLIGSFIISAILYLLTEIVYVLHDIRKKIHSDAEDANKDKKIETLTKL